MGLPRITYTFRPSAILNQTLQAFGITKPHTTAYHPQGDGMVDRLNRSTYSSAPTGICDKGN